ANLGRYLDLMAGIGPRVILLGEAPGYRGMTITGVPFVSRRQLAARPGLITGDPDGDGFDPVAGDGPQWEASSAVVWNALAHWCGPLPISWPIYPHHPFVAGDPSSNRPPRPAEVRAGTPVALELIRAFGDPTVVAVGRKAQGALAANGIEAVAIRHPAQGGARMFTEQLAALNTGTVAG
ncbi:MAG TPA: uracil-DNA glycosylase, partial [Pseudolysinimonas sp.]|nr:uracil-DNA glycosylase [Pseudolysinimonas sp.]